MPRSLASTTRSRLASPDSVQYLKVRLAARGLPVSSVTPAASTVTCQLPSGTTGRTTLLGSVGMNLIVAVFVTVLYVIDHVVEAGNAGPTPSRVITMSLGSSDADTSS